MWLDDELTDTDRRWIAGHHQAPALLHRVDAFHGLTPDDYRQVTDWLRATAAPPGDD